MDVGEYIRNKNKTQNNTGMDFGRYSSMGEEQLVQELFRTANESNVTNEELDGFFERAKPYLTAEQREKMKNLIMQLKR